MAQRVVLHIGSMKSGTSYMQNVLGHNKERLREAGVLFPAARWKAQVAAVQDLIAHGGPGQEPMADDGLWRTLAAEVNHWPDTAVISMEFLGPRSKEQIERIRASFPGSRVEVLLSARDLGRQIPAMWLESMQNGSTTSWDDYLDAVRTDDRSSPAGRNFWRHQAVASIARRWQGVMGPGSLTVLTVPRSGAPSSLLWERYASVLGVEPAGADLDVRANPSIGLATAEVLLRLNRTMRKADGTLPASYDKYVKHTLAKRGLVGRTGDEPKLGLDAAWVTKRGNQQVAKLRAEGYHVVGDLDELRPRPVRGVHPDEVSVSSQLDAAVDGIAHLVAEWSGSERTRRRTVRQEARRTARLAQKSGQKSAQQSAQSAQSAGPG